LAGELTISTWIDHEVDAREAVRKSKKSSPLIDNELYEFGSVAGWWSPLFEGNEAGGLALLRSCLRIIGSASAKDSIKLPTHQGYPRLCQMGFADVVFYPPSSANLMKI
jgi:hypothetical protein